MLLQHLMNNEFTNKDFQTLNQFLDRMQLDEYTDEIFEQYFKTDHYSKLIDYLRENSSKKVFYNCLLQSEDNVLLEDEETACYYCGLELIDDENHELTTLYSLSRDTISTLRTEALELQKNRYFTNLTLRNIEDLKKSKSSVVPFVGAGLSVPLGLPDWTNLLQSLSVNLDDVAIPMYLRYTDKGDMASLFKALDILQEESVYITTSTHLKEEIAKILISSYNENIDSDSHNIYDLLKLNSNLYITTNYDLSLVSHLSKNDYRSPLCINDISNIRQLLQENAQVLHLHGHINRKETMIISEEDYNKLYKNQSLMNRLAAIIANRPFMFVGFSFKDDFFSDMYDELRKSFESEHYIVVANPDIENIRAFREKDIKVIGLNLSTKDGVVDYSEYVPAFRTLINYILE